MAPDKFSQKNLFITVRFSIGGKKPVFIECDLSKKHLAKDVVRHVLTLYRKNKAIKEKVQFSASVEEPEAFELRYVEDDSDSDSEEAQYDVPTIDWFVPHQANQRILTAVARKLKLRPEQVVSTVSEHANTSAASVPLAWDAAVRDGRIKRGDTVMLEAFGGGFTWGACLLRY